MALLDPICSTDSVWRGTDEDRCLSDDLNSIEADISALETGKSDTDHSHTGYATAEHTHTGYADVDHTHTDYAEANHTHTGFASENHSHSEYAEVAHSHADYAPAAHTHTDYAPVSHNHSEYATTDHTHTGFASETHNHDNDYSDKSLQITSDTGSFKYSYKVDDGKNILDEIKNLPSGMFTVYSQSGTSGNPKTTEAWRLLVHKTGDTVLWVKAFGSLGSEYSNYCADGVWQGWRCIYDDVPAPLWSGEMYMTGSHTITPTKALSDCAHGWLLLWSDYNAGEGVQNVDFATTMIPERAYTGQIWNGAQWLCSVPRYADSDGEASIIKALHIYDAKIVGNDINTVSPRNDVVLRAVYEF